MKKIIFHYSKFNVGGAEMSNLRMMNVLVRKGWQVELVLNIGGGSLERQLDSRIKIVHLRNKAYITRHFLQYDGIKLYLLCLIDYIPFILSKIRQLIYCISYLFKHYDIAVVGLQGLNAYFISKTVNAKLKLLWIRSDLTKSDLKGYVKRNISKYNQYIDYYMCVSQTVYQSLISIFPHLKLKAKVFYNILDKNEMLEKSLLEQNPYFGYPKSIKIVTVCRMQEKSKGLFRMYSIYKQLKAENYNIHWFLVGDGDDYSQLKQLINAEGNNDGFILLGSKENPFPYYKYADISATLSYYEGLCGAINEAKVMSKCVIATECSGTREQIIDGKNGIIVNNDESSILSGMRLLLNNKELREKLKNDYLPAEIENDEYKFFLLEQLLSEKKNENLISTGIKDSTDDYENNQ